MHGMYNENGRSEATVAAAAASSTRDVDSRGMLGAERRSWEDIKYNSLGVAVRRAQGQWQAV